MNDLPLNQVKGWRDRKIKGSYKVNILNRPVDAGSYKNISKSNRDLIYYTNVVIVYANCGIVRVMINQEEVFRIFV